MIDVPNNTIILEPQHIFNDAIIKFDGVLYYSLSLLIESFLEKTDMTYHDIIEHLYYNTWGSSSENWPELIDDLN